jgi:hypothetical protein
MEWTAFIAVCWDNKVSRRSSGFRRIPAIDCGHRDPLASDEKGSIIGLIVGIVLSTVVVVRAGLSDFHFDRTQIMMMMTRPMMIQKQTANSMPNDQGS